MPWVIVYSRSDGGPFETITTEMLATRISPDDPLVDRDVHIVPCGVLEDNDSDFGVHEFSRMCSCHPHLRESPHGIVIHREIVN